MTVAENVPYRPGPAWPAALLLASVGGACGALRATAVPADLADMAVVPGFEDVRDWSEEFSAVLHDGLLMSFDQEPPGAFPRGPDGRRAYDVLLVSSGGGDGAFGAGLLVGWTQVGDRPTFKVVCGVSAGALIAPFAFLGSGYDAVLEELATGAGAPDLAQPKNLLGLLNSDALLEARPLEELVERCVTRGVLEAVARAHEQGRRLYVATTNLDAQRQVNWDLGAIAVRRSDAALELFRDVVRASASVPLLFEPVYLDVEVDGTSFAEMHVDGALRSILFAPTESLLGPDPEPVLENVLLRVHVIRNGFLGWEHQEVRPRLAPIAVRAYETTTKSLVAAELRTLYLGTLARDGVFRLASIPESGANTAAEPFQGDEMDRLFDLGRTLALSGEAWQDEPPEWVLAKVRSSLPLVEQGTAP